MSWASLPLPGFRINLLLLRRAAAGREQENSAQMDLGVWGERETRVERDTRHASSKDSGAQENPSFLIMGSVWEN